MPTTSDAIRAIAYAQKYAPIFSLDPRRRMLFTFIGFLRFPYLQQQMQSEKTQRQHTQWQKTQCLEAQ
jgi:hypothetical protein